MFDMSPQAKEAGQRVGEDGSRSGTAEPASWTGEQELRAQAVTGEAAVAA